MGSMKKCENDKCEWLRQYGKCASVCIKQGYARHITNYDQLKDMDIEQVAMVIADLIFKNDRTVRNKIQAVCYKMALFDRCMRWLSTEVDDD